jgi:hypothetical protein
MIYYKSLRHTRQITRQIGRQTRQRCYLRSTREIKFRLKQLGNIVKITWGNDLIGYDRSKYFDVRNSVVAIKS